MVRTADSMFSHLLTLGQSGVELWVCELRTLPSVSVCVSVCVLMCVHAFVCMCVRRFVFSSEESEMAGV